ncbi:Hypothetical protein CINCED_3A021540 [Cinara cedri]|uniref:Uncharacterized protein n=1 Tax=Cinara cedri TaxID=506608 RepID=A0A5E4M290_9HEMI|nr:Hypothetical protein CINCED_3A021540 [Cinara cedri]
MWSSQVNRLSKTSPKYLTWLVSGNNWLQSLTGGQLFGRMEKVMWLDLFVLDHIVRTQYGPEAIDGPADRRWNPIKTTVDHKQQSTDYEQPRGIIGDRRCHGHFVRRNVTAPADTITLGLSHPSVP